jgi:hypothetical protein
VKEGVEEENIFGEGGEMLENGGGAEVYKLKIVRGWG